MALSRTTLYTLTNRRVVFRIGIALPMAINIPFSAIAAAGVREGAGGTGDIVLTLTKGNRIAYSNLWPHVRPWRFNAPEPLFRTIADVGIGVRPACLGLAGRGPGRREGGQCPRGGGGRREVGNFMAECPNYLTVYICPI